VATHRSDKRPVVDCSTVPSRTRQHHKDACDINVIVAQYRRTGQLLHLQGGLPTYGDVSEVGDFRSVLERVRSAEAWFMKLPAKVRAAFENSPAAFMDAVEDPARQEELVRLGLLGEDRRKALLEREKNAAGAGAPAPAA